MISEFALKVIEQTKRIPKGKVATYKQIGELAGKSHASRGVGWILHSCATRYKLPWQRVINSQGKISFKKDTHNFRRQKKLLETEGVVFKNTDSIDLQKYQWKAKPKRLRSKTGPKMFS